MHKTETIDYGIILSGGPASVYAPSAPLPDPAIFRLGVPILGICYGVQLLAQFLGGKVEKGLKREYGKGTLQVKDRRCPLFAKLPVTPKGLERIQVPLSQSSLYLWSFHI
jgi:GMP synthase-like glutamine amidotransferase